MVTFDSGNHQFEYRVAAVVVKDERVLLCRAEQEHFWSLPGGKVELNENSSDALLREMREKLDSQGEIIRLQWVLENFFEGAHRQHHEIVFCYLVHLPNDSPLLEEETFTRGKRSHPNDKHSNSKPPAHHNLIFQWFPRDLTVLEKIDLLPAFLRQGMIELPAYTGHIISQSLMAGDMR